MTNDSILAGDTRADDAGDGVPPRCPACGTPPRRRAARFCHTCGRVLTVDDGYAPIDLLRASYHAQHVSPASRVVHRRRAADCAARLPSPGATSFIPRQNRAAAFALASIVYALIPLLGIVFCLPAIVFGGCGVLVANRIAPNLRSPERDGHRAARFSFFVGWWLLSLQLLLWWALAWNSQNF